MSDIPFTLNGRPAVIRNPSASLLDALREEHGLTSVKDGCSPQGQCGCCTVWVDGQPRVACVTPSTRVRDRAVTTLDGLAEASEWTERFAAAGASQCGFCTPGIIMRLAAIAPGQLNEIKVRSALSAHLCRCTGWQTIVEAACAAAPDDAGSERDLDRAARRAGLEGRQPQRVGPDVAAGRCGFAADQAPPEARRARRAPDGQWVTATTMHGARTLAAVTQGRRTTAALRWPIELPDEPWVRTLHTTWIEPAYLELDASWATTGTTPASPLANAGAFGAKQGGAIEAVVADLTRTSGAVTAQYSREDAVRLGAKRPPLALGMRADGSVLVLVARTPGITAAIHLVGREWQVHEVDIPGPPTSAALRAAGWLEAAAFQAATPDLDGWCTVRHPDGAEATARIDAGTGHVHLRVSCGDPLDHTVLRSYCIGAAHMALGMVRSEAIAVDGAGEPLDLTIRSFGILRATDMPDVHVEIDRSTAAPVNGSDAVMAAVAAAAWAHAGHPPRWPTMRA